MHDKRYTDEFKIETVKQITKHGYPVQEVAQRLGVSTHSLYAWKKKYGHGEFILPSLMANKRLKAELKRVTKKRDILKKGTAYFAKESL